jgi:hypothetical protein
MHKAYSFDYPFQTRNQANLYKNYILSQKHEQTSKNKKKLRNSSSDHSGIDRKQAKTTQTHRFSSYEVS